MSTPSVGNLNLIFIVLVLFVIGFGVIFFINISQRYFQRIGKFGLAGLIIITALGLAFSSAWYLYLEEQPLSRNTERSTDVQIILAAVSAYAKDQNYRPDMLSFIPNCPQAEIGQEKTKVNLLQYLAPEYLAAVPTDPLGGTAAATGYTICRNPEKRFEVSAPKAENGTVITVKQ